MTTIPYKKGYKVKPSAISSVGRVTFTDGTNDIIPNQKQCEAYGYTYDKSTATCRAFRYNAPLIKRTNITSNNTQGDGNITEAGSVNTYVMGESNIIKRGSRNNSVVGTKNQIETEVLNSIAIGRGAKAIMDNTIVLGGNSRDDRPGTRQSWTIMYGGQTTDNSTIDIFPNNTALTFFQPLANRVYYFQSETLAVRSGGSSGSGAVGDFKSWVERGVVKCNGTGTLSIDRSRTSPADSGTTGGWSPINAVDGSNFRQTVKGASNMNIEWVSTIRFMELWAGVSLP
ncbi:MAG: hypothetical protein Unbinned3065contig1007_44 [Prokaryotic dsDNA virus sp.]|nr:MAG: hypothetical protein Unbinned3065contig1007_44 [Prokaryotic dsDNA virus sp.]|tara:strand:- start:4418 stop:5272 length:855 start_codon:yes stop_codon:yes gene_type:complete